MIQYTFKTYISGGVEHYVYGEEYADDTAISSQAVAFPDSLLSLVHMDIDTVDTYTGQAVSANRMCVVR